MKFVPETMTVLPAYAKSRETETMLGEGTNVKNDDDELAETETGLNILMRTLRCPTEYVVT